MNTYSEIQNLLLKTAAMDPGAQAMANSAQIAAKAIGAPAMKPIEQPKEEDPTKQQAALASMEAKHRAEVNKLQGQMDKQRDENAKLKTQLYQAQATAAAADAKREMAEARVEHSKQIAKERIDANDDIVKRKTEALSAQQDAVQELSDIKQQSQDAHFEAAQQAADTKAQTTVELAEQKAKAVEELANMKADAAKQMAQERTDALAQLAKDKSDAYMESAQQTQKLNEQAIQQQQQEMERNQAAAIDSHKQQLELQQQQAELEQNKANMSYENDIAKQQLALEAQKNKLQQQADAQKQQQAPQQTQAPAHQEKLATVLKTFRILTPGEKPELIKVAAIEKVADIDWGAVEQAQAAAEQQELEQEAALFRQQELYDLAAAIPGYNPLDPTASLQYAAYLDGVYKDLRNSGDTELENWNKANGTNYTRDDLDELERKNDLLKYYAEQRLEQMQQDVEAGVAPPEVLDNYKAVLRKHEYLSEKNNYKRGGLFPNFKSLWARGPFGDARNAYEAMAANAEEATGMQYGSNWYTAPMYAAHIAASIPDAVIGIVPNTLNNIDDMNLIHRIQTDNSLSYLNRGDVLDAMGMGDVSYIGMLGDLAWDTASVIPFLGQAAAPLKAGRAVLGTAARLGKVSRTAKQLANSTARFGSRQYFAEGAHALESGKGFWAGTSRLAHRAGDAIENFGRNNWFSNLGTPWNAKWVQNRFPGFSKAMQNPWVSSAASMGVFQGEQMAYNALRQHWGGAGANSLGNSTPYYSYEDPNGNIFQFNSRLTQAGWDPEPESPFDYNGNSQQRTVANRQLQSLQNAKVRAGYLTPSNSMIESTGLYAPASSTYQTQQPESNSSGSVRLTPTYYGTGEAASREADQAIKAASAKYFNKIAQDVTAGTTTPAAPAPATTAASNNNTATVGNATLTRTDDGIRVQDGLNSTFAPIYALNNNPFMTNDWSRFLMNYGPIVNQVLGINAIPAYGGIPYNSRYVFNPVKMDQVYERALLSAKGISPEDQSKAFYNELSRSILNRYNANQSAFI